VETCWKKHGVPPHLQKNFNSSSANHVAKEEVNAENTPPCVDLHATSVITHEQYEKLMSLLQNSSSNHGSGTAHASNQVSSSLSVGYSPSDRQGTSFISSLTCHNFTLSSWIIDSGASDHICGNLKWFHSYNEIAPIYIKLPTGHFTIAKQFGTIKFSQNFVIHNVLYVPEFHFNLISVSKLSNSLNCIVIFDGFQCLIQDTKSQRMIGSGDKREDLYYLSLSNKLMCAASKVIPSYAPLPDSALWHFRLGHLSFSRMQSLKSLFPFVHVDSCHTLILDLKILVQISLLSLIPFQFTMFYFAVFYRASTACFYYCCL